MISSPVLASRPSPYRRPSGRTRSLLLTLGAAAAIASTSAGTPPSIGANLNAIADWSRDNTFVDLMKQGRPFGSPNSPWDLAAPVGSDGWPTGDAGVVLMVDLQGLPGYGGVYRVSVECPVQPTISLVASSGSLSNVQYDQRTQRLTAEIDFPEGGAQLMLAVTNTQGHGFKHLRVVRPGFALSTAEVFTPQFIDHIDRFDTLRFMHWGNTVNSPVEHWSQRTTPEWPSYIWGVPWEVCVDLCNTLDKDAWITIPHLADDEYVAALADLVRDRLEPERRVWVEWSNEVWNWGYGEAQWNIAQAEFEVANDPLCDLNYDGVNNPGYWAARRIAREIMRVSGIFRDRFGEAEFAERVRPVLAHQIGWPALWLHEGLRYLDANHGHPADHIAAVAGAPYLMLGAVNFDPAMTSEMVLDALESGVADLEDNALLEYNAFEALWYGLPFVAYEGGPDTAGELGLAAKIDAALDPRMGQICKDLLTRWYGYGFGHFDWFQAGASNWNTPWGTFTLTNDMTNQSTPKILALDEVIAAETPPLTEGRAVPGAIDLRKHVSRLENWESSEPYWSAIGLGHQRDFLVRATRSATYRVHLVGATDVGGAMTLSVDGAASGNLTLAPTGGVWAESSSLFLGWSEGMHALRLTSQSNYTLVAQALAASIAGDFDGDGDVDGSDLAVLLGAWGSSAADIDGNGTTDAGDLAILLGNW